MCWRIWLPWVKSRVVSITKRKLMPLHNFSWSGDSIPATVILNINIWRIDLQINTIVVIYIL